jgi:hypothetical protein
MAFYPDWKASSKTLTRDGKTWFDQDERWRNDLNLYDYLKGYYLQEEKKKRKK